MLPQDVKKLLKKENAHILEIGANDGRDTAIFLQDFGDIRIYCFEPDPRCIRKFRSRIHDPRCVLIEAAVSDASGSATLSLSTGVPRGRVPDLADKLGLRSFYSHMAFFLKKGSWHWYDSSSIVDARSNAEDHPWLTFKKRMQVRTIRLDEWVKQSNIGDIDFIWSDVQGAEKKMIRGAEKILRQYVSFILNMEK